MGPVHFSLSGYTVVLRNRKYKKKKFAGSAKFNRFDLVWMLTMYVIIMYLTISGIIASVDDASMETIQKAVCAAQSIFDNLKDIPVPGHSGVSITARAGLHAGEYTLATIAT